MSSFEIIGGNKLKGEITPQGAKNEALQILCAVMLTSEKVTVENVPNIIDVNNLIALLEGFGVKVTRNNKSSYTFKADNVDINYINTPEFEKQASSLRGSVMLIGPLLARFGICKFPQPGGDKIGRRRLDTHFLGLIKLGAKVSYSHNLTEFKAKKLKGCYMHLEEASVTGTANIIMASVLAEGITTIYNAACEPYIIQLCRMLVRMGANINGIGSNLLTIEGVKELKGTTHTLNPDMIEVGSFIGLAAMTQSEINIVNVNTADLGIIPTVFQKLGIKMEVSDNNIFIPSQSNYEINTFMDGSILTIADAPWPGFTPDLISIALVTAIQAKGSVLIHQKMFESRLFFVDKLIDMGAQIILCDPHRATVIGLDRKHQLRGVTMTSPDIRAGVALLIAALSAEGKSIIHNVNQIDRGYQDIDIRLNKLGANIKRINKTK
ncbi:MAG: UDP-N-acetylglucosamine 1-carboxyvinyltransferase [Bacteroidales bacterium]|jgi:UDP-N-acetylglucosamine 1-carboxyvinyltransferase